MNHNPLQTLLQGHYNSCAHLHRLYMHPRLPLPALHGFLPSASLQVPSLPVRHQTPFRRQDCLIDLSGLVRNITHKYLLSLCLRSSLAAYFIFVAPLPVLVF